MAVLYYKKYQNKSKNLKLKDKWFGRVVKRQTLSLGDLAEHIASHGSVYTEDVVMGVLTKFKNCLLEHLYDGQWVKIDGLGTFSLALQTTGAESAEEFTQNNITAVRIRFKADQSRNSANAPVMTGKALAQSLNIQQLPEYQVTAASGGSNSGNNGDDEPGVENP